MDLSKLPDELIRIGRLLGLITGDDSSPTLNTNWFSTPTSYLEQIPDNLNQLAALLGDIMGPGDSNGQPVFNNATWYPIPNPKTDTPTPFYLVATLSDGQPGQLGLGWMAVNTYNSLAFVPYVYVPLISYSDTGIEFILASSANPCQLGLSCSNGSTGFTVTSPAITFSSVNISANIYLCDNTPTVSLDFVNLTGATFTNPVTTLAGLQSAEVLACLGEVLVQGTTWLDTVVTGTQTIGSLLVDCGFLSGTTGAYSLDLSNLSGSPETIALNVVSSILKNLASQNVAIITLPGGGIYIQSNTSGNTTQYGVQFIATLPLTASTTTSVELSFGGWLSGDTDSNNWMTRSQAPDTLPPGLCVWILNETSGNNFSFVPSFSLCSFGINVAGVGNNTLFDLDGYTLKEVELRATWNPVDIATPSTWTYGFAGKLDQLGFPLVPSSLTDSGSSPNPVAQNLLQSNNSSSGSPPPSGDQAPANPTFGVALSWYSGGGIFDVQLFDAKDNPTDEVDFLINRQMGPLDCQQIGVGWVNSNGILSLLFDGSVKLGPLSIALQGLNIGVPIYNATNPAINPSDLSSYTLGLQGLGLSFNAGSVSLNGNFVEVTPQGQNYSEYDGTVSIQAGKFAITALGSYAYLPPVAPQTEGYTSMFLFGILLAQLGGPEFFFVTGLAAGFGYNRAINLPDQNDVSDFPFVGLLNDPTKYGDISKPSNLLSQIETYVPAQRGEYWLAAGVRFTSFSLINTSAVVSVEFGNSLEIGITGLSWMSLPPPPSPGGTVPNNPYAYAELGIDIQILPDEGLVSATAILTPNSFVIDPSCHLTGGFAFYVWFGNNPYAGQFVLTIGGYNPNFNPPSYFPQVPRLGFNWNVSSTVTISGDAYFALTPSAIMAGGGLSVIYSDGNLRAWFIAQMDALVQWAPFQYNFSVSVSIGVSYKLNLLFTSVTLSVELGASIQIYGPQMGGSATITWYIISFTVPFGADPPVPNPTLSWSGNGEGFADIMLPNSSSGSGGSSAPAPAPAAHRGPMAMVSMDVMAAPAAATSSTVSTLTIAPVNGYINNWVDTSTNTTYWVVRPASFAFSAISAFPATQLNVTPIKGGESNQTQWNATTLCPAGSAYQIYVRPMSATVSNSTITVELYDVLNNRVYDLAADFDFSFNIAAGPASKWGPLIATNPSNGMAGQPEMNTNIPGLLWGFDSISTGLTELTPSGTNALTIDITSAFTPEVVDESDPNFLPLSTSAQPSGQIPQVSSSSWNTIQTALQSSAVTTARSGVYNTLISQFGIIAGADGTVTALASNPGAYLNGYPLILQTT